MCKYSTGRCVSLSVIECECRGEYSTCVKCKFECEYTITLYVRTDTVFQYGLSIHQRSKTIFLPHIFQPVRLPWHRPDKKKWKINKLEKIKINIKIIKIK